MCAVAACVTRVQGKMHTVLEAYVRHANSITDVRATTSLAPNFFAHCLCLQYFIYRETACFILYFRRNSN